MASKKASPKPKSITVALPADDAALMESISAPFHATPQRAIRLALRCFDAFIPPEARKVLGEESARLQVADEHLEIWCVLMAQNASVMLPHDLWEKIVQEGGKDGRSVATVLLSHLDAHYKIKRAPANVGATRAKEKGYDAPYFNAAWRLNGEARARYLDALWQLSAGRDGEPSPQTQINQAVGQALERVRGRLLDAGVEARVVEGVTDGG